MQKLSQGLCALFSSKAASPNTRNKVPQPVQNPIQRRLTDIVVAATASVVGVGAWLSRGCHLRTLGELLMSWTG
jgi:hypothetical protein